MYQISNGVSVVSRTAIQLFETLISFRGSNFVAVEFQRTKGNIFRPACLRERPVTVYFIVM